MYLKKHKSIIIQNYSNIFGGQERYAESLLQQLALQGIVTEFEGGPNRLQKKVNNIIDKHSKSDNVIIFNGNAALYKSLKKLKNNCFWVYVQHSDINDGQQASWKRWLRKILIYILLKRFDLVIRVCNKALPDCYARGKIKTIYNGVNLPKNWSNNTLNEKLKLLMVGAINTNKNQRMAIAALQYLPYAELTIVGSGESQQVLTEFANDIGVGSQINWIGFIDNLEPYYVDADILLMLSHFEAFPYAVLEAMSFSVPVISVPVGGVPEIINDTKNGWLLDNYNTDSLVNVINAIKAKPEHYAMVAISARMTIEQNYTVEHMTQNLLDAIEEKLSVKE